MNVLSRTVVNCTYTRTVDLRLKLTLSQGQRRDHAGAEPRDRHGRQGRARSLKLILGIAPAAIMGDVYHETTFKRNVAF